ncbi:MAG: UDP-3-O-(3-hydroxymyristoyl)glucosamine N-acyltransferase [Bacteroidales bacterium]|nr:UDP-3-O-(3-hydroxymyristoyl)glucosamine N-acyltransferase [Bacteroidales bacterium]
MQFTAEQIAGFVQGKVEGNPATVVNQLSKIEEGKQGSLSFLANPKYNQFLYSTDSSIVIINETMTLEKPVNATLIRVKDAYTAFAMVLTAYQQTKEANRKGISEKAHIDPSATIGNNCYIGEFVFIGSGAVVGDNTRIFPQAFIGENVKIGTNCLIHPAVKILDESIIGNHCTFHSGVVIGSDGFGFAPQQEGDFQKVPQIGNVIIEDWVELGANTTIDRATMGSTILRRGVKLDNLCQIAHNVEVGENTVMAAQSGVAGSTKIGKNCMIGGQVAINGHITIANGVKLAAKTGVSNSIKKENDIQMGIPSFDQKKFVQSFVIFKQLPDLAKKLHALEKDFKSKNAENQTE